MIKSRQILLALAIVCSSSLVLTETTSLAKTSKEMISEKEQVDQKVKKLEKEIQALQQQFDENVKKYDLLKEETADVAASIEITEKDLAERKKIIANRLKAYQAQDSTFSPYIEAVFGAENFTQIVTRTLSVKKMIDADEDLRTEQQSDMKQLKAQQKTLKEKELQLEGKFRSLQEQQENLTVKKAQNKAKSLKLKEQIATAKEKERLEAKRKAAEKKAKALLKAQREAEEAARKIAAEEARIAAQLRAEEEERQREREQQAQEETHAESETITTTSPTVQQEQTSTEASNRTAQSSPDVSGSDKAKGIIAEASKYLGQSYVWGGSTPSSGFDCSGLTSWSFKQNGITIPRTAAQQYAASTKISASEAKAGDLVFFSYGKGVAHVGIYLGDGRMINAQNSGLKIAPLAGYWSKYIVGYGRFNGVN